MIDPISDALLCGLGLALLTDTVIKKTVEHLVKQSKFSEEEGQRLVKDLQQRSHQARAAIEAQVDAVVRMVFQHIDLPETIKDRLKDSNPAAKPAKKARARGGASTVGRRPKTAGTR
jgi:polyhydroxyalkanoate synthesis regulator phasin